jgi:type VI secretion system protein ImpK
MRIVDCFMELMAYAAYFLKTVKTKQPSFEQIKTEIDGLTAQADTCLQEKNIPTEDREHARFAVFAWVDEIILNSAWDNKDQWMRNQLQRRHFQTTGAGELFFERLNSLGTHQGYVREVYYLCLALGFTGRYIHEGDDFLLEQLKTSNLKILLGSSIGLPSLDKGELFPAAYPEEQDTIGTQPLKKRISPVTITGIVSPVVLFGILFIIYRFILSNIGNNLLGLVP